MDDVPALDVPAALDREDGEDIDSDACRVLTVAPLALAEAVAVTAWFAC